MASNVDIANGSVLLLMLLLLLFWWDEDDEIEGHLSVDAAAMILFPKIRI
jgi:hypothetical protein